MKLIRENSRDNFNSKGWTGILLVLSQLLSVFANLVGGYCADRFGRKRMMVFAASPVFLEETVSQTTIFSFGNWDLTMTGQQLFGLIVSENGLFVALFMVIVTK
ncbi:hypothetical protein [Paenibacillus sp. MMS18-CY102]|uniref:hypothetical protein n=1 Tax=Paenibacillus sp. MMS18-CY102 TaxID=2682849 RepID=UPI001F25C3D3|nr:hypothetical protein [Paenibacillus sp. MMS18-CY102]